MLIIIISGTLLTCLTNYNDPIFPIWNTTVGQGSTSGTNTGYCSPRENEANTIDENVNRKYCAVENNLNQYLGGLNTEFYVILSRGASILREIQFATAHDVPERDPLTITIEGSNETNTTMLTSSYSWQLIYNETTGLENVLSHCNYGPFVPICNSFSYSSYRLFVTSKRGNDGSTQYSDFELLG
jgi:hypothetical protein